MAVRGGSSGVGYMRRAALVIGCGDSDLSARIASDRSEGVGFKSVLSLNFLRVAIGQMAEPQGRKWAEGQDNGENGSSSDASVATMTWEHGECLSMPPADFTFDLVINNGALDCVMCSLDQTDRRTNMYMDEVERVIRMGELEDEDAEIDNNKGGGEEWYKNDAVGGKKCDEEGQE